MDLNFIIGADSELYHHHHHHLQVVLMPCGPSVDEHKTGKMMRSQPQLREG